MKKQIIIITLILYCIIFSSVQVISISPETITGKLYVPIFINIKLNSQFDNPFDPDVIKIDAIIISPDNKKLVLPLCFISNNTNNSLWQLRFTPVQTGKYTYKIKVNHKNIIKSSKTYSFNVKKSALNGFIRLNSNSFYSFKFDSGKLFRGIGENVAWTDDRDNKKYLLEKYEHYFKTLSENKCNTARVWMAPWNIFIEWQEPGLGKYNLEEAKRIDDLIALAEKYGIYIILCLDYHGVYRSEKGGFNEQKWHLNPYNAKLGGPCKEAKDFFSNTTAKKYYKQRLRYLIARYSYSTNILVWEFLNEAEQTAGSRDDVVNWHREMAAYIKDNDPHQHLVSTSYLGDGYSETWKIKDLDFSQTHHYNDPNMSEALSNYIKQYNNEFNKPHVIGEFGIDYRGPTETRINDPYNIGLHNGLWGGLFSPTPILPLTWWWDNLIDPDNLYYELKNASIFNENLFNNKKDIQEIKVNSIVLSKIFDNQTKPKKVDKDIIQYQNGVLITTSGKWGKRPISVFRLKEDGTLTNQEHLSCYLYGKGKEDIKCPPEFIVDFKNDGKFFVHVNNTSHQNTLKIFLDGQLALIKPLKLGEEKGDWKKCEWNEQWQRYQGTFDKEYGIDVPVGKHSIIVENDGLDWIEVISYRFTGSGIKTGITLEIKGLEQNNNYYLWLRQKNYYWQLVQRYGLPEPILSQPEIVIPNIPRGKYNIEWFDTYKGEYVSEQKNIRVKNDKKLKLTLPKMKYDIACRIIKID